VKWLSLFTNLTLILVPTSEGIPAYETVNHSQFYYDIHHSLAACPNLVASYFALKYTMSKNGSSSNMDRCTRLMWTTVSCRESCWDGLRLPQQQQQHGTNWLAMVMIFMSWITLCHTLGMWKLFIG